MEKVAVDYEKMYYGFPAILISFYDVNGTPNVTTISSSYTLRDMVALGFNSKGYAVNQIKAVKDFVINVPDRTLSTAVEFCGAHTGYEQRKFDSLELTPVKSPNVNAPAIKECPITMECTLTEAYEREPFKGIINVVAQIKGRYVAKHLLDENGRLELSGLDNIIYAGDGKVRGFRYLQA